MHYDDRLTTVLAGTLPTGSAAVAQYRQLVDILGQIAGAAVDERHAPALARIHMLRTSVSEADRLLTVQCLSGRLVSPVLVQYLAAETPSVASAAIRAARLDDDQWAALVPALPMRARGFLRHRRDLGPRTRALLDQLGLHDTALPASVSQSEGSAVLTGTAAPAAPVLEEQIPADDAIIDAPVGDEIPALISADDAEPGEMPAEAEPVALLQPAGQSSGPQSIGEIVKRIEALQEVRFKQALEGRQLDASPDWNHLAGTTAKDEEPDVPPSSGQMVEAERTPPDNLRFSTGVDGALASVSGIALGAVYGLSLAMPALAGFRGVDAAVATAFSRRMPVRGGRATLGNIAGLAGEWRIDADPGFDRATGRFIGYSGVLRRPMAWESAGPDHDGAMLAGRDGLRQIVHELRTPLNAIMGFSEIIEQQLFGPVTAEYRDMALKIRQDARQLLSGFDDLDTALRLDRNAIDDPAGHMPLDDLVERLSSRAQPLLEHSGAMLSVGEMPSGIRIAMSQQAADRIVPRLAGALIGSCAPGETLALSFADHGDALDLCFSRPLSLAGLDEDGLFDVDRSGAGQGDGGPLLGLGFCLRLVRNLLVAQGGRLTVDGDALRLTLPRARISPEAVHS